MCFFNIAVLFILLPSKNYSWATISIPSDKIERTAFLLKSVAHPLRLKMIKLIKEHSEVNVNVIYNTLKMEQSITSQHLKMMREAEVVSTRRAGKKIFYSLNKSIFDRLIKAVDILDQPIKKKK